MRKIEIFFNSYQTAKARKKNFSRWWENWKVLIQQVVSLIKSIQSSRSSSMMLNKNIDNSSSSQVWWNNRKITWLGKLVIILKWQPSYKNKTKTLQAISSSSKYPTTNWNKKQNWSINTIKIYKPFTMWSTSIHKQKWQSRSLKLSSKNTKRWGLIKQLNISNNSKDLKQKHKNKSNKTNF